MLAALAEVVLELVLTVFLEFICYAMGNLCVSVCTLGRWSCEGLGASTSCSRRKRRYPLPSDTGLGPRQVSVRVTQLIGFLAFVLLVGMAIALSV